LELKKVFALGRYDLRALLTQAGNFLFPQEGENNGLERGLSGQLLTKKSVE